MGNPVRDHGNGSIVNAGGDRLQTCLFSEPDDLVRYGVGGNVDVTDRCVEQFVPYAATNKQRTVTPACQGVKNGLGLRAGQPVTVQPHQVETLSASTLRMRAVAPQI